MTRARQQKIPRTMTVAGLMSGTSADGIDVALVRIAPRGEDVRLKLVAHRAFPYARGLREAVLAAMNAPAIAAAELARLNWRLGIAYAEALKKTITSTGISVDLAGCHGQTIYHQGKALAYHGRRFACTWQLGEPALIAAECGVPVVANFRPADMTAGGQGAPLVSLLDFVFLRHARRGRVLQNLGGIGNLTAIPASATMDDLMAFDTGPANMVMDWLAQELFHIPYDEQGRLAAQGRVLEPVLKQSLRHRFFRQEPPKTAGREEFGREFAAAFLALCRKYSHRKADAVATAAALTAESIARAYREWVAPTMKGSAVDYVLSGGGAVNPVLVAMLRERLEPLGCRLTNADEFGLPAQAKEAVAFALMAWQTWHHRPGNVPAATGALRPAILGQVCYV